MPQVVPLSLSSLCSTVWGPKSCLLSSSHPTFLSPTFWTLSYFLPVVNGDVFSYSERFALPWLVFLGSARQGYARVPLCIPAPSLEQPCLANAHPTNSMTKPRGAFVAGATGSVFPSTPLIPLTLCPWIKTSFFPLSLFSCVNMYKCARVGGCTSMCIFVEARGPLRHQPQRTVYFS